MFDIAFSELVLIGLVALVVLGPRRLQEAARTAGRWMARLRRFVDDVKRDMDAELRQTELGLTPYSVMLGLQRMVDKDHYALAKTPLPFTVYEWSSYN